MKDHLNTGIVMVRPVASGLIIQLVCSLADDYNTFRSQPETKCEIEVPSSLITIDKAFFACTFYVSRDVRRFLFFFLFFPFSFLIDITYL